MDVSCGVLGIYILCTMCWYCRTAVDCTYTASRANLHLGRTCIPSVARIVPMPQSTNMYPVSSTTPVLITPSVAPPSMCTAVLRMVHGSQPRGPPSVCAGHAGGGGGKRGRRGRPGRRGRRREAGGWGWGKRWRQQWGILYDYGGAKSSMGRTRTSDPHAPPRDLLPPPSRHRAPRPPRQGEESV